MTQSERQERFIEMVKSHERLILKVCAMYTDCCRAELCDLYQDAVCALWESYGSFRDESKPSTWIYSVTRYTMLHHLRKRRLETSRYEDGDAEKLANDDSLDSMMYDIRDALQLLKPEDRDLAIMWMEGFDNNEMAAATRLTYGVVATRLTRIKTKLRNILVDNKKEAL